MPPQNKLRENRPVVKHCEYPLNARQLVTLDCQAAGRPGLAKSQKNTSTRHLDCEWERYQGNKLELWSVFVRVDDQKAGEDNPVDKPHAKGGQKGERHGDTDEVAVYVGNAEEGY
jgi:hypothetical protein